MNCLLMKRTFCSTQPLGLLFLSAIRATFVVFATIVLMSACSTDDEPGTGTDDTIADEFDRTAILINWADNIIVPAYQSYAGRLGELQRATAAFTESPDEAHLNTLRDAWLAAYLAWQSVEMFEIGKAEEIGLRNFTNIFPTNAAGIEENISEEDYTLALPSKRDEQGFPALDYLLFEGDNDASIITRYTDAERGQAYRTYLTEVVNRLVDLTDQVVTDWDSSYRDSFVSNTGASATSSFNKLVNDYLFYYEKGLRAGKVGIPAGVFSGTPLPETVEGRYAGGVSKLLFDAALDATQNFFNGKHFASDTEGESLKSYLSYLNSLKDGEDLGARINQQFGDIKITADALDQDFTEQINTNNDLLLTTYDQLQRNVVLMKVDMFQALNVKVDFVDADGD